jgi:beta-lactam-binding protein with PASTA domain
MRPIFVSYRREDAEGEAGRLFDDLVGRFGENSVFLDVAAIEIGRDFRKAIDDSVSTCGVLLAIIGKGWIDAKNEAGERRLDDPTDFVRLETASALKRDIPVIPVLVHGAKMPRAEQLPEDLKELAYRNGVELTHARWRSDLDLLVNALKPYADPKPVTPAPPVTPPRKLEEEERSPGQWWNSRRLILASVVAVLVIGAIFYRLRPTQRTVPDLSGSSLSDATLKLQYAGLGVGSKTYQPDPDRSPDTVLRQAPLANARVDSGTAVDLVLAQRISQVEVPALTGRSLVDAATTLRDSHLAVGKISWQPNSSVAQDTVLAESPAAGKKVDPGTAIELVAAQQAPAQSPAPPAQVEVPPLRGRSLVDAATMLRDLHLAVGKIGRQPNSSVAQDTVLSEFPAAGTKVSPETAIDLEVAQMQAPIQGPALPPKGLGEKVKVPNFAGTWELFAITENGVSQAVNAKSKPLVVTQNGTMVHIFGRELQITPAGTVGYQTFAAHDDKSGHEVATAAEADLVDTLTCRIDGSNLVYETVFEYRHQYFNHPPGREVRVMTYRRVGP